MPDDDRLDPTDITHNRTMAARSLVHILGADSWGLQHALISDKTDRFVAGFATAYTLLWQVGELLQTYLTDDERDRVTDRLRQEIASQTLAEEGE